jgi:hypothetical protein
MRTPKQTFVRVLTEKGEINVPLVNEYQNHGKTINRAPLHRKQAELISNNGPNPKAINSVKGMPGSKRNRPISASHTSRMRLKKDITGRPIGPQFQMTPFNAY